MATNLFASTMGALTSGLSRFLPTRTGSWGTPELSITENIQKAFAPNVAYASSGGSNLLPDNNNTYSSTPISWNALQSYPGGTVGSTQNGVVLGSSTTGGTGGTGSTGTTNTGSTGGGEDPNAALWAEIDNIFNTTMGYADQREATARENQKTVESDIAGQYEASRKTGETQKAEGERNIAREETTAGNIKEDALNAGRRLYNELSMAGQAMFGGASSAGLAHSELIGREFQRGQADVQTKFQTAMAKITDLKANLQDRWDAFVVNLDNQKNTALNDARRYFQDKLSEIDAIRAEAGINKSQMRLEVLQNLRNQIYNIQLATTQTLAAAQQQLTQNQTYLNNLEGQVTNIGTGAQNATNQLSNTTTTNPKTAYNVTGGGVAPTQTYTGIRRPEDEQLYA